MGSYLSYEEYKAYGLDAMEEGEFNALSTFASRIIDAYTFNAIERYDLMNQPYYASKVKDAMAYQIFFMGKIGEDNALGTGAGEGAAKVGESETIGSYSHSISYGSDSGSGKSASRQVFVGTMQVAPLAVSTLAPVQALGRKLGC